MDKDNSQESMISSNSLSFGKNRGGLLQLESHLLCRHRLYHLWFQRRGNQLAIVKEKLRAGNG